MRCPIVRYAPNRSPPNELMAEIKARRNPPVKVTRLVPAANAARPKPVNSSVAYRLRNANKALARSWEVQLQHLSLEEAHYYYLRALFEEDGITQADLGERVGVAPPAVTGVLDRMVEQGFVRRGLDPHDRRKRLIYLTRKGSSLRLPLLKLMQERNRTLLGGISNADYAIFSSVLDRIVENSDRDAGRDLRTASGLP